MIQVTVEMPMAQSEVHTQFGPVNRKRKYRAGWWKKKNEAPRLVAGVRKRVILRRPAQKALPNLSLNVSDTLCALRALNEAALLATIWNLRP